MEEVKEIGEDIRKRIVSLHKSGLGYKAVSNRLCMPCSTVQYTVKKEKPWGTVKNLKRSGKSHESWSGVSYGMFQQTRGHLLRISKLILLQWASTSQIRPLRDVCTVQVWKVAAPDRPPLLKKFNINACLKFAREHVEKQDKFWDKVLWSGGMKFELYWHNDLKTVWRKKGEVYHPKNTISTVKHSGENLMLCGCFSSCGVGKFVRVHGIMKKKTTRKY